LEKNLAPIIFLKEAHPLTETDLILILLILLNIITHLCEVLTVTLKKAQLILELYSLNLKYFPRIFSYYYHKKIVIYKTLNKEFKNKRRKLIKIFRYFKSRFHI
jgi:hypothetical protein